MSETLRGEDDVREWLAHRVYAPDPDAERHGKVGLEAEFFPFWVNRDGGPAARLALVEIIAIIDDIAERAPESKDARPSWRLDGALITEEPGAQVEVAGPPEPDAGTAIAGLEAVVAKLVDAFVDAGAALASAGLDLWSAPELVPVQLDVPRYEAMTTYFGRRGDELGHLLMCASCSLQVNLDLGPPAVARDRWLLANLAAPVLTAAFAASPSEDAANGRAMGWRGLDPTRTGAAPPLVAGSDDPLDHVVADALRADVMMVERDGRWHAGEPGWSFRGWLGSPHVEFGRPTTDDLATHLTTLFPEARLRGWIEVRGVDELPAAWRGAAVALVVGLLYDEQASEAALERLRPHRAELPDLLGRAARAGLGDPVIARLTGDVLEVALAGARRLTIPTADDADRFLDAYTRRGRQPTDDLRDALADSPAAAFRLVRER